MTFSIQLPTPPSTNRIWRMAKGRMIKSKEYRQWLKSCHAYVWFKHQDHDMIKVPYRLDVIYTPPNKVRQDLDNICKGISDLLELAEVVENDKLCHQIYLELAPARRAQNHVLVRVSRIESPPPA